MRALWNDPFCPSRKSPKVTMALPSPQAAMYSLSSRSPTLVALPLPEPTLTTFQVLPPSPEFATRTSGFCAFAGPTKRKPSVA
jgi:hypothetical protein